MDNYITQAKCLFFVVIICLLVSCVSMKQSYAGMKGEGMCQFIATVSSVEPLATLEDASRKKWKISIVIEQVLNATADGFPHKNESSILYVHSVAKTFRRDKSEILGKSYKFTYYNQFNKEYVGKVKIENP